MNCQRADYCLDVERTWKADIYNPSLCVCFFRIVIQNPLPNPSLVVLTRVQSGHHYILLSHFHRSWTPALASALDCEIYLPATIIQTCHCALRLPTTGFMQRRTDVAILVCLAKRIDRRLVTMFLDAFYFHSDCFSPPKVRR